MRIAILDNGTSDKASDRVELVATLQSLGYEVSIGGIYSGTLNEYYTNNNIKFLALDASRNNTNPVVELLSIFKNAKILKNETIENVIIYGIKNHPSMAVGAKIAGINNIICVVNGSGNLFRIEGIKGALLRTMAFPVLRIAYRGCKSICFQNTDDLKLFQEKKLISKNTNTFITGGSGVNLEGFPFCDMPNENRFLFLSRITASKGLLEFCKAARIVKKEYHDAIFDIVGPLDSTVENNSVHQELESAVNDNIVNYHGYTDDVPSWMKSCRYFVYPSFYPEGVPRCAIQALATGRPIITCNSPGCKETVIDKYNGLLIEPRDVLGLAEGMRWLIEHKEEAEVMAINSRKYAEEKFDVNIVNEQVIGKMLE
ncbi:MAG: glycosyltransferase family 4 protein [Eubacterium sp.]|nr:glycosyltransferase family 4 protein [Eubacterium sp.]